MQGLPGVSAYDFSWCVPSCQITSLRQCVREAGGPVGDSGARDPMIRTPAGPAHWISMRPRVDCSKYEEPPLEPDKWRRQAMPSRALAWLIAESIHGIVSALGWCPGWLQRAARVGELPLPIAREGVREIKKCEGGLRGVCQSGLGTR